MIDESWSLWCIIVESRLLALTLFYLPARHTFDCR
jgi:hypothetical protein